MNPMDVTVIVCTYNRADSLRRTLEALAAQQVPAGVDWELVVVDNNSRDDTRATVERFALEAPLSVTYVFEAKQGVSYARNTGLSHSTGENIAFTDDDVLPAPDWVATLETLMAQSGADVIGGRILPKWPSPVPGWLARNKWLHANLALMDHEHPHRLSPKTTHPLIWGANMAFRRSIFDVIGLFDTRRGRIGSRLHGGEDVDIVERALAAGAHVLYDPRLVVWHHIPCERIRRRYFLRWYFQGGEGEALSQEVDAARTLLGAPLHRYRYAAMEIAGWFWAVARRHPDAMRHATSVADALGCLSGHWKRYVAYRRGQL